MNDYNDQHPIINDRRFAPGSKEMVSVPVTTDLDGNQIAVRIHVVTGRKPGPTLALLSTLHGGEFLSIEVIRRLVRHLDPEQLAGNVLAVPVGNPVALQMLTRNTPDESDAPDLNRVFPGQETWIAEQLARTITKSVLQNADCLIDFHMGLWGSAMGVVSYAADAEPEVAARSRQVAFSFGYPCIKQARVVSHFPGPRSALGYASAVLKIPAIGADIGGAGFDHADEEHWLQLNVQGVCNVMSHLGMLEDSLQLAEQVLMWEKRWRVNPSVGGYLIPEVPPNSLMREVKAGEVLAQVVSPYSFEVLERLRAPGDGVLMYTARSYPVRPGDWAFGVVDLADEKTMWVPNPLAG